MSSAISGQHNFKNNFQGTFSLLSLCSFETQETTLFMHCQNVFNQQTHCPFWWP